MRRIYKMFGRILSSDVRAWTQRKLTYAGIKTDPESWVGLRVLIAFLFAFGAALVPWATFKHYVDITPGETTQEEIVQLMLQSLVLFVVAYAFIIFTFYMHVYYLMDDRTKRVEAILPDYLFIVSANLRAGMSTFNAFKVAALPHFGPLKEEIDAVASKATAGGSLSRALMELSERIDSEMLRRTIIFFEKGTKAGGRMAELLEVSADEMRKVQELKKEMVLQTKSYTVFIVFIVVFIIPLLMSISSQFLSTMIEMRNEQAAVFTGSDVKLLSILQRQIDISPGFIDTIALVTLGTVSLLVSMFIGTIGEGKLLYGIKYYPIVLVVSVMLYFAFKFVVASMLSSLT